MYGELVRSYLPRLAHSSEEGTPKLHGNVKIDRRQASNATSV